MAATISAKTLEELMEKSIQDYKEEPAFFRALLDAEVFVHAPFSDKRGSLQLMTFPRPKDGLHVVPVFTDEAKANWAARGGALVLKMKGRMLMEITRGSTLMLNPNDTSCTLYPEEIVALLETGTLASFANIRTGESGDATVYVPDVVPESLKQALRTFLPTVPMVERAYVAGIQWPGTPPSPSLLVVLTCPLDQGERAVRAVLSGMSRQLEESEVPIDITYAGAGHEPDYVAGLGLEPVFERGIPSLFAPRSSG